MDTNGFIHDSAEVHSTAVVGDGTNIWNWTKVREGARIGGGCNIGIGVYVDTEVTIGDGCKIQNGALIYRGVSVGDNVFIGPHATFTNDLYPRAHNADWRLVPTEVHDGASIGANATIVCGTTLGKHCMVAAGAVVTKDVPAHALVMGHPARIVDYLTVSGRRLNHDLSATPPGPDVLLEGSVPSGNPRGM